MSNPAMPGLIKIGRSSREPISARVAELSSATGVPSAFKVEYQAIVRDEFEVEQYLHRSFSQFRYGKEFFKDLTPAKVVAEVAKQFEVIHADIFFEDAGAIARELLEKEQQEKKLEAQRRQEVQEKRRLLELETLKKIKDYEIEYEDFKMSTSDIEKREKDRLNKVLRKGPWRVERLLLMGMEQGGAFGFATREYGNGEIYVGNLRWGKRHGHGTYRWKDGRIYVGEWKSGEIQGWGRLEGEGWRQEGSFMGPKLNGFGIEIVGSKVCVGLWADGKAKFIR